MTVIKKKATLDKVTKNKLRYIIEENDELVGTIYLDREDYSEANPPKTIEVGVRIPD